jgi:hypothetical protein
LSLSSGDMVAAVATVSSSLSITPNFLERR